MTFPSTSALLQALAWPAQALEQRGTLTWVAATGEGATIGPVASAAVLVGNDHITLRLRATNIEGHMEPHLEAKWAIRGDEPPTMVALTRLGQERPLNEQEAIEAFQDRVNLMNVRPQFQGMAKRTTPAASTTPKP